MKRRFWKDALGDEYESPSQCYTANTQKFTQINETGASLAPRTLTFEGNDESEADRNLKKLDDFIKNRKAEENHPVQNKLLPDTELPDSGKNSNLCRHLQRKNHFFA